MVTREISKRSSLRVLQFVVTLVIVGIFVQRAFGGTDPTLRFFDDFFYYVKPAHNFVAGAGSVYFPGEPTNGYHPLWFLWVALLWLITGGGSAFFGLIDLSLMCLMLGFFFLYQRFLLRVTGQQLAAAIGAAVAAIFLAAIAATGVELALTVFAVALLLDFLTRKPLAQQGLGDVAIIGLLGSFLMLSRLDAVILAPGLAVAIGRRWDWKRWVVLAAGTVPVGFYFIFNLLAYGHVSTTSMRAKSLAVYWPPNLHGLEPEPPLQLAVIAIILAVLGVVVLVWRSDGADVRRIAMALATAPLLQFASHAVLSGWLVFPWYFYLTVMTFGLGVSLLASRWLRGKVPRWALIPLSLAGIFVVVAGVFGGITPESHQKEISVVAHDLQTFSAERPGVYAMGDAAGAAGYLMSQPIVHLEGLMMSHDFIDRIRERQSLQQVFRDYHVNYFVSVWSEDAGNGCRHFIEPAPLQSSPRAPHMEMTTCASPVEVIRPGSIYQVRVYRIDPRTGQAI